MVLNRQVQRVHWLLWMWCFTIHLWLGSRQVLWAQSVEQSPDAGGVEQLNIEDQNKLVVIRHDLDLYGYCSAENLAASRQLQSRYPQVTAVTATLTQALMAREDWDALAQMYGDRSRSTSDQLFLAKLLVRGQRYADASQIIYPIADQAPADAEAAWIAALVAFHLGDHARSAAILDRSWDQLVAAGRSNAGVLRGLLYLYTREHDKAEAVLAKLLEQSPNDVPANNAMGRVLAAAGRREEAGVYLERARQAHAIINSDEQRKTRLSAQARALSEARARRRFDECESLIADMLAKADDNLRSRLFLYLSEIYEETGRNEQAAEARNQAVQLEAADP